MNNKAKLLLGLTSILAVSGAVAATSTFAWFTTTRTAQVNITSATVYSSTAKLQIAYSSVTDGGADSGTVTGTNLLSVVGTTKAKMTDISGDGHTMYRPDWLPGQEGVSASSIGTLTNSSGNYYYLRFGMTLTNVGNAAMTVYLNTGSKVFAHVPDGGTATDESKLAAKATRIAFLDGDTVISNWQFDTTDGTAATSYKYLTTGGSGAYNVTGYQLATPTASKFHVGTFSQVHTGFTADDAQTLCTLDAAGGTAPEKTITVTMWLEGTSSSATNTDTANAVGGLVDAQINLAAL